MKVRHTLRAAPQGEPPQDTREKVFDALQAMLSAWGLYSLLVQFLDRGKR
jgi:hypothetical protein